MQKKLKNTAAVIVHLKAPVVQMEINSKECYECLNCLLVTGEVCRELLMWPQCYELCVCDLSSCRWMRPYKTLHLIWLSWLRNIKYLNQGPCISEVAQKDLSDMLCLKYVPTVFSALHRTDWGSRRRNRKSVWFIFKINSGHKCLIHVVLRWTF